MKTRILKAIGFGITAMLILSVTMGATKNVFKTMQDVYGLQPYGQIINSVTDMIQ